MRIHRILQIVGVSALLGGSAGCYSRHHHPDAVPAAGVCALATCFGLSALGAPPDVAVTGALVAGAVVMDHHDNHWHGNRCGCPSRWYDGYRVYWYGGHWEYYEQGQWYRVPDDRHHRRGRGHGHGPRW